jgi:hypothetical protein
MRNKISFLDRICFISDPDLARSFENKEHLFVDMMVMERECALTRGDHGHVVPQLWAPIFWPTRPSITPSNFAFADSGIGAKYGANSSSEMLMIGIVIHSLLAATYRSSLGPNIRRLFE